MDPPGGPWTVTTTRSRPSAPPSGPANEWSWITSTDDSLANRATTAPYRTSSTGCSMRPRPRAGWGRAGTNWARVWFAPVATSVTSWPSSTSPSTRSKHIRSIPPYRAGGTSHHGGATTLTRRGPPERSGSGSGAVTSGDGGIEVFDDGRLFRRSRWGRFPGAGGPLRLDQGDAQPDRG